MRKLQFPVIFALFCGMVACNGKPGNDSTPSSEENIKKEEVKIRKPVDQAGYDVLLQYIANDDTTGLWPVPDQPLPLEGAVLPYNRIVAYYGNLYSKNMGVLGEYPPDEVWRRLDKEVEAWKAADPNTPVLPAIHYIAVVAQGNAMKDGKWRFRMPAHQIDSALAIAKMRKALVFLDVQVGLSTVEEEIPQLEKYLLMPHVHLGIDPEFSMKDGTPPGKKIGTYDAKEINFCSEYLAELVRKNNLPPKILVIHRFTKGMLTNYKDIRLRPEVQIVINMDGFGRPELKYSTYERFIRPKPVQFTGFKLFYKNDVKQFPHHMLAPEELMKLRPRPVYIQYQ
ncbi:MAG: hypothetical protein VB054_02940 [Petrimonas sp.]|nr:hypothetical protein [Petrimonas sp.]